MPLAGDKKMTGVVVAVLVALVTTSWLLVRRFRNRNRGNHFPPCSAGLPLIGNTLEFMFAYRNDDLQTYFEKKARKYGPVFRLSLFGSTFVILDSPQGDKFLFANDNNLLQNNPPKSIARLFGPSSWVFKSGKEHQVARRHLVRTFLGPEVIGRFVQKMERNAIEHLEKHWNSNEVCVGDVMSQYTLSLIADLLMSVTDADELVKLHHEFGIWSSAVMSLPINVPGLAFHSGMIAKEKIFEMLGKFIQRRKEELKQGIARADQDLMSALLTEPDEEGHFYTDAEIRDNLLVFLFAGIDTSSAAFEFIIRNIAKYPEVYEGVVAEQATISNHRDKRKPLQVEDLRQMKYTWRVVQESMRVTPIVNIAFRQASQDLDYKDYKICKGWKVLWNLARSQGLFEDQEKFDPSRFEISQSHIFAPFLSGPRHCPGSEFAKLQILTFLHHLVKNYRWSLVDPNEKIIRTAVPRTLKGSPVTVTKCSAY